MGNNLGISMEVFAAHRVGRSLAGKASLDILLRLTKNPTIKVTPQPVGEIVAIQMQIIIMFFGIVGLLKPIGREL